MIALVRALQLVCYVSACFGRGWLQAAGVGDMWRVRKGEGALYIYICKSLIRRCFFLVAEKSSESSADDCHFVVALMSSLFVCGRAFLGCQRAVE